MEKKKLSHVQLFCVDYHPSGSSVFPLDFPGNNTGVGCCFLLQGIFPTRDWICISFIARRNFFFFKPLSHQGSPNMQVTYAILIFSVVQISPYSKLLCRLNTILINIYWVFYRYMVSLFKTCMEIQGKFNFKRNLVKE